MKFFLELTLKKETLFDQKETLFTHKSVSFSDASSDVFIF